ncbi:MAG TPA: adenylosuccinate synthase [bacterium]|nr:adenylosuccinate synthase [bacterium]
MPGIVVVGAQWGDEGKGKVVDLLTRQADIVARYQGGNNAGHTVMFEDKTFILHLVPSGIFHPGKRVVLGNGVVVDPEALLKEVADLRETGVEVEDKIRVSDASHVVMPYHKAFDKLREGLRGPGKIGTTGRGIGPTYEDKMGRRGVRFSDFSPRMERSFRERLEQILEEKNFLLRNHFHSDDELFDLDEIYDQYCALYAKVEPYLCDTSALLNEALDAGQTVLFEGAQGSGLDVDHGTYPYVTSSNTVAGGACTGCGVGPTKIDRVIGIAKAYTTRVGEGPFPTELSGDPVGEMLQKRGQEVGATTGRVRRCGWFDAVVLREAVRVNGLSGLAIMKMDVLDELESIKLAVGYEDEEGHRYERIPHWMGNCGTSLRAVYEEMPGWHTSTRGITEYSALPAATRAYLDRITELCGVPITVVSTGPRREETIVLQDLT